MKRLLAALDMTPRAEDVLERAVQISSKHKAKLTTLHVIDEEQIWYEDDLVRIEDRLKKKARQKLDSRLAGHSQSVRERTRQQVVVGVPEEAILRASLQSRAELIVLGQHRVSPLKYLFVGTVAERIIRNSPTPILIAGSGNAARPYKRVLVATDFSSCSERAMCAAFDLAPDAEFHILHMFKTPFHPYIKESRTEVREYKQQLVKDMQRQLHKEIKKSLKAHGSSRLKTKLLLEEGDAVSGIAQAVRQLKPDLLVMGTHGRTGLSAAVLGSVVLTLLNDSPCDMLVAQ